MKVTLVTQVYNGKQYFRRTIESVLNQTYKDLEFIVIDNGSTDGVSDLIKEYAEKDSRVKVKTLSENKREVRWTNILLEMAEGEVFANIDSDDWYAPTFVEHMADIYRQTNADIIVCGSLAYVEGKESEPHQFRQFQKSFMITKPDFAAYYTIYHQFFRTTWGKLVKVDLLRKMPNEAFEMQSKLGLYGIDTYLAFTWLKNSEKVYCDASVLHNYLMRNESVTYTYEGQQLESDIILYNQAMNFLGSYGAIAPTNENFVNAVYANAVKDTVGNIKKSDLSPEDKMSEFRKIIERGVTYRIFRNANLSPYRDLILGSQRALFVEILKSAAYLPGDNEDWKVVKKNVELICK